MALRSRLRNSQTLGPIPDVAIRTGTGAAAMTMGAAFFKTAERFAAEEQREKNVIAQREGTQAGQTKSTLINGVAVPTVTLREGTAPEDVAFNQAALRSYRDRLNTSIRQELDRQVQANPANGAALQEGMAQWSRGMIPNIPEQIQAEFANTVTTLTQPFVRNARRKEQAIASNDIKATSYQLVDELSQNAARTAGMMASDDGTLAGMALRSVGVEWQELSKVIAEIGPDGAPLFTATQQEAIRKRFFLGVHNEAVRSAFMRSPDKRAFREEWEERERSNRDSPFALNQIDRMSTWMDQQIRQEDGQNDAARADLRAETREKVRILGMGKQPANLEETRAKLAALGMDEELAVLNAAEGNRDAAEAFAKGSLDFQRQEMARLQAKEGRVGVTSEGRNVFEDEEGRRFSEKSATVTDPRINEGRPTNIPTVFGGRQLSEDEAIDRIVAAGGRDPETGRMLPGFDTIEDAVSAARERSANIQIEEGGGLTLSEAQLQNTYSRIHEATVKALAEDPYTHGVAVGVLEAPVVPDFSPQGLPVFLSARESQGRKLAAQYGVAFPLLTKREAEEFSRRLMDPNIPAQAAADMLASLQVLDEGTRGLVASQVGASSGALGIAVESSSSNPPVARDIISGLREIKLNPAIKPTPTQIQTAFKDVDDVNVMTAFVAPGATRDQQPTGEFEAYRESTEALAVVIAQRAGRVEPNDDDVELAARLAMGGVLVAEGNVRGGPIDYNGRATITPIPGMTESEFRKTVRTIPQEDLVAYQFNDATRGIGPSPLPPRHFDGRPLQTTDLRSSAYQFHRVLDGVYAVWQRGFGYVMRGDGRDIYTIDLRRYIDEGGADRPLFP